MTNLRTPKLKIQIHIPHGMSETKLVGVWYGIKKRCLLSKDKSYKYYGGRGIKICQEWMDPRTFFKWALANGYKEGLVIDRRDNDGHYCPENCRWVTRLESARNRRSSHLIVIFGEKKCLTEWALDPRCRIGRRGFLNRLVSGLDPELALISPSRGWNRRNSEK